MLLHWTDVHWTLLSFFLVPFRHLKPLLRESGRKWKKQTSKQITILISIINRAFINCLPTKKGNRSLSFTLGPFMVRTRVNWSFSELWDNERRVSDSGFPSLAHPFYRLLRGDREKGVEKTDNLNQDSSGTGQLVWPSSGRGTGY